MKKKTFNLSSISDARGVLFGIATLWILLFHSMLDFSFLSEYNSIFIKLIHISLIILKKTGNTGVEIFLFLSGLGLYYSFSKDQNLKSYYKRRALRIIPAAVIVAILQNIFFYTGMKKLIFSVLFLRLFYDGNRLFWFVTLIILLYAIYPFIFKLYKKYNLAGFVGSLAAVIIFNLAVELLFNGFYLTVEILLTRIPVFFIGAYAAKFVKEKKELPISALCASAVVFLISNALLVLYIIEKISLDITVCRYIHTFLAVSLIVIVSFILQKIKSKCQFRFLTWVGKYSFEVYLFSSFYIYTAVDKVCSFFNFAIADVDPAKLVYTLVAVVTVFVLSFILKKITKLIENLLTKKPIK